MNDFKDVKLPTAADVAGWQVEDAARRGAERKKKQSKFARLPGQEVEITTKPYTVKSGGTFTVAGKGNPDAALTGPRPKNPEEALTQKEGKGS